VEAGRDPRDTLFVSFEDPALLGLGTDARVLDLIFDAYLAMAQPKVTPHLFLDEVQNVDGWARWVRARTETGRAHVVVSGSSSRLLEPDVASVLTGRNYTETVWPLSFPEFLRFRGLEVHDGLERATQAPRLRQELERYLRWGGLPEPVLEEREDLRGALLKQYFRDMLYRDVVSRHEVRDVRALESVAHHYLVNTANLATYQRVKNTYGLALDQVRAYTSHLEECYLIRQVPRWSPKVSTQARAPRKVYAVDVGLRNAVAFRFSEDRGRLAETVVHGQLLRDDAARVYHFHGKGECDFVVWRGDRAEVAIQVCQDDADELPARELAGLHEALDALGLTRGLVLTRDLARVSEEDGRRIEARPLWLWLAEGAPTGG
jgi:uncharacterized protein